MAISTCPYGNKDVSFCNKHVWRLFLHTMYVPSVFIIIMHKITAKIQKTI